MFKLLGYLGLVATMTGGCEHAEETKDRLTAEAMQQMVEKPLADMDKLGLSKGIATFEQLLATQEVQFGTDSVQVADLITAFGLGLYKRHFDSDEAVSTASLRYLRLAIPHYRKAFGPEHPEVAVALHTFADADVAIHDGRFTPNAKSALEEALRIRRATLGPDNIETRATVDRLAELEKPELF